MADAVAATEKVISKTICAARAAWYGATEGPRLRLARRGWVDKRNPLVTCYVPTYNRAELLCTRALPSILAQTYTNLEIIIAAHGCNDEFYKRLKLSYVAGDELNLGDERLRWIDVPRKQTYKPTAENHWFASEVAPANAALKAARGAWIARIDDDDEWKPNHIDSLLDFAQRGDYEFVSSAYKRKRDGREEYVWDDGEIPPIGGHQTWLYRSYLRFMRYNQDCWRKPWNAVNDTDLADRFRRAGVRIGHLNKATAYVYPRPGDTTVGLEAYRRAEGAIEKQYAF